MDAPRQVVNFGPGPAKLPRSVSPRERARRVHPGREHKRGWWRVSARVAMRPAWWRCISAPGAGIPTPRPESPKRSAQACTPSSGSLAGGLLEDCTWGRKLGEACLCSCSGACTIGPAGACWPAGAMHLNTPATLPSGPGVGSEEKKKLSFCVALPRQWREPGSIEWMHEWTLNEW